MVEPRTIKYRAWDVAEKIMRPVARISLGDDGSSRTVTFESAPIGPYYRGLVHGENGILLPYIGLNDKNDAEIYEHDLVDAWSAGSHCIGVIKWGIAGFFILVPPGIWYLSAPKESCEVVGNIYQHPELVPAYLREHYNSEGWLPPLVEHA